MASHHYYYGNRRHTRTVHARPNEHIYVSRRSGGGGGNDDLSGCIGMIIIGMFLLWILGGC